MPAKVISNLHTPQSNGNNMTDTFTLQPGPSDFSGIEDGNSREGRLRKKLQKNHIDGPKPSRHPEVPLPIEPEDNKSVQTSRRRPSLRNHKVPQGARPLTRSPSKYQTTTEPQIPSSRATSTNIRTVPRSRQTSVNNGSQSSTSTNGEGLRTKETPIDVPPFLPPANFDDLHASLSFSDSNFLEPQSSILTNDSSTQKLFAQSVRGNGKAETPSGTNGQEVRIGRSGSLRQHLSNSIRQKNQQTSKSDMMGPPPGASASKPRRQSHFPLQTSTSSIGRAPRKSIGPGVLPNSASDYSFLKERPAARADREQGGNPRQTRPVEGTTTAQRNSRASLAPSEELNVLSINVNGKPKTNKVVQDFLQASPKTPDSHWNQSINSTRSPIREPRVGTSTPSSGKRLSVMPGHATGLGARTISPTDARRMKRLSMMPTAPPLPQTPPVAFPEPSYTGRRSAADSPSLIPRKSVTPSSSRTTPDPNRKSFNSGISTSSNASFSSLRMSAAASRAQPPSALSRLPTLKGRTDGSQGVTEEGVPPVPAIPKAYESPKNEHDVPFFSTRKSSLPFDATSLNSTSTIDYISAQSNASSDKETPRQDRESKQRRHLVMNSDDRSDERASGAQNGRRTLQPLKLPPLNLLPASAPTASKIAALSETSEPIISTPTTPPPRRPPKTPSTPMTASRAHFFHRNQAKDETGHGQQPIRSTSSHYALRTDLPSFRAPSSSSSIPGAVDIRGARAAVSPFVSTSLPKSSIELPSLKSKASVDRSASTLSTEMKASRLTGPRAQTSTKLTKAEPVLPPVTPTESESTSLGTSIRRKLSLSRKRSTSKAEIERPPQPPDHETMPPPKLPASATWTGQWAASSSPTQKPSYLHTRRKSSYPEGTTKHSRVASETVSFDGPSDKAASQAGEVASSRTAPISSSSKIYALNGGPNPSRLQIIDTQLDREDLVAEEEMKRLALKRKNTELAARELDELRRRAVPRERVSPSQALKAARLNIFERGEIIDFEDVYFCGTQTAQKVVGDVESERANFGYDDERGDYNIVVGDHLAYRYEVVDILGKGSFGQVVRCVDHKTGGLVAIKIIRNKKRFHQQALVEVNILQKLREWDPQNQFSMVNFTQSFYFRGHLCISTELLGMNLYEFIKVHDFKGFSLKLIRRFTKQMLNSLVLLKSHKVIHCDLKPENILLAHPAHSEIKVIDFGSSCLENEKVYTYIQSRFYRSPEVILGMTYGMPIDMWSLGCILAELLTGYPIFPGENEQEQLACIMEVFGPPDKHLIEKSSRKKLFFDSLGKPRLTVSSKGKRRRPSSKTLQQALKCDDEPFLDFLSRCLRWDPDRRMKPDEAIHHEFITGIKQHRSVRAGTGSSSTVNSSPIKRFNSVHTTSASRPLPEPPATVLKNGIPPKPRDTSSRESPNKAIPKRHSTVAAVSNGLANTRKGSNGPGPPPSTSLPKLGPRVASGRSDLASAAAAAAATKPR